MRGKFIVIEGIDSSGKGTQLELLAKRIKKLGKKVLTANFPRYYTSPWGKLVGQYLIGKFGKVAEIDPHFSVLPFMLDQYTWVRDIGEPWLKRGGVILLDRYFTSNVHQVAKLKSRARKLFREWLWTVGYDDLGIIRPDQVLFLNVSPKLTRELIKKKRDRDYLKGRKTDSAERDWQHQWAAYREYIYMVKHSDNWQFVRCTTNGKIDTPFVIHERIWKIIERIF